MAVVEDINYIHYIKGATTKRYKVKLLISCAILFSNKDEDIVYSDFLKKC